MQTQLQFLRRAILPATLLLAMFPCAAHVQAQPHAPAAATPDAALASPVNDADAGPTQTQLLKLLRLSPTLTSVVESDPSLLSNQEYVARNNPELAQFLIAHPEVARNPTFYLFSDLDTSHNRREDALEQKIWPESVQAPPSLPLEIYPDMIPALVFVFVVVTLLWLIRMLLQNRRWSRIFRLQTEIHTKLIDRFGSNQELLTYMDTDAGKRFLEAAPIPVDFDGNQQRLPNAVARVILSLQIGVVLTLLGIGLLFLRHSLTDLATPLLVFGTVILMPGLGFIVSAGITWILATRLGLMPDHTAANSNDPSRDPSTLR
ncbi:MAG: hypothetical protein WB439_04465 [Acidobacteriaceae bacterium]